jgi:glycopeptide antibiotics resistance protein
MLDLILNTVGGLCGATIFRFIIGIAGRRDKAESG